MNTTDYTAIAERLDKLERLALLNAHPIIDIREAADFTGFSKSYLYKLTMTKQIPYYKKNHKVLFKKSELEDWMLSNRIVTQDEINRQAETYLATHK